MVNAAVLDNVEHQDIRLIERRAPEFGDAVNEAVVFPSEIPELSREYAIYFRMTQADGPQAFALLGLDPGENLFVSDGAWRARRLPAMMQRGPFLIGMRAADDGAGQPVLMLNLDDPRVSRTEGTPLFLRHGGSSPALERSANALRTIHSGLSESRAMFDAFLGAGLLAPLKIDIRLDDRTSYALPEIYSISEEALANLSGDALHQLNRAGLLALAFHIRASLGNISWIIDEKNRRRMTE